MKTQIEITIIDGAILVAGPYSAENNTAWRNLGGKYTDGQWRLPDNDTTRAVLAEKFGPKSDLVNVLVPVDRAEGSQCLQIGGYVLAERRGRDSAVKMPDGVSLAAGAFSSRGGSVKNPRVAADGDTVFRLCCRRSFAEARGLEIAAPPAATIEV